MDKDAQSLGNGGERAPVKRDAQCFARLDGTRLQIVTEQLQLVFKSNTRWMLYARQIVGRKQGWSSIRRQSIRRGDKESQRKECQRDGSRCPTGWQPLVYKRR